MQILLFWGCSPRPAGCPGPALRLTQDVTTLEIQPTLEDVFHADTSSVEDYLKQVEEATILAAIQVCPEIWVRMIQEPNLG